MIYSMLLEVDYIMIMWQNASYFEWKPVLLCCSDSGEPLENESTISGAPYILLTLVCRQVYHETCLLPYSLNTFSFERTAFWMWNSNRLPVQRNVIRTLDLPLNPDHLYERQNTFELRSIFPALEKVYVDVTMMFSPAKTVAFGSLEAFKSTVLEKEKSLAKMEKGKVKFVITHMDFARECFRVTWL